MEYININIRGLISNLEELRHFVSTRKASFICVCETFLTGAVPDSAITISGYSFFRKDRGSHGGGLVVYFKSHLNVSRLILEAVEYETIWFSTHTRDYHYVCCAAYWPPNTQTILTEHLSDSILSLNFSYNTCLLIMGDFNAHYLSWPHCTHSNNAGRLLASFLEDFDLHQLITEPTRLVGESSACLDLVITNVPFVVDNISVMMPIGTSDHSVISFICIESESPTLTTHHIAQHYPIRRVHDWTSLNDSFLNTDWDGLFNSDSVEQDWDNFKSIFHALFSRFSTQVINNQHKTDDLLSDPTFTRLKSNKYRQWRHHLRCKSDESYSCFVDARKALKDYMRAAKSERYRTLVNQALMPGAPLKRWFNLSRKLYHGSAHSQEIPPLLVGDQSISDEKEKADLLNTTFTRMGGRNGHVFKALPCRTALTISSIELNLPALQKSLRSLDPSKSVGPDGITNAVLRGCAHSLDYPLLLLFKKSLAQGRLPADWKAAYVTPIYKNKGASGNPVNYRPISVTSNVGKILEQFVNQQILSYLTANGLLSNSQFGFLPKHSTTDQLSLFYHECLSHLDSGKSISSVFLDLSAAFDSVPHDAIRHKLPAYGIRGGVFSWISDYLSGRSQQVKLRHALSDHQSVGSGVPQGSVLAPTLFLLFINDLSDSINVTGQVDGCPVETRGLIYADDTMIMTGSTSLDAVIAQQNFVLQCIDGWARDWGMSFNPDKTVGMFFSRTQPVPINNIIFRETPITFVKEHKHLGFTITSDLKFNRHIDHICRSIASHLFLLRRLSHYLNDTALLLRMYKCYIRPHFEYASPVCAALGIQQHARLEKLQRRAIRIILNYRYSQRLAPEDYSLLGLSTIMSRKNFALACYGFKLYKGLLPSALSTYAILPNNHRPNLRRQTLMLRNTFYPTSRALDRSPLLFACKLLNAAGDLLHCQSMEEFKSKLWANHAVHPLFLLTF